MMMRVSVLLLAILSFASNHSFANAVLTTNFVCGTGGPGTDHPSTDGFNYCAQNQQCPCGRCCYCECQVSAPTTPPPTPPPSACADTGAFKFNRCADPGSPSSDCVGPFTSASGICGGSGTTFSHNSWKGAAGVDRSWPTIKDYESLMSMPSSNTPTGAFTYWLCQEAVGSRDWSTMPAGSASMADEAESWCNTMASKGVQRGELNSGFDHNTAGDGVIRFGVKEITSNPGSGDETVSICGCWAATMWAAIPSIVNEKAPKTIGGVAIDSCSEPGTADGACRDSYGRLKMPESNIRDGASESFTFYNWDDKPPGFEKGESGRAFLGCKFGSGSWVTPSGEGTEQQKRCVEYGLLL